MKGDMHKEFLRVNIDLPSFKLEIKTGDPHNALSELRRILESLNLDEDLAYEEFVTEELKMTFSETFVNNQQVMGAIKKLLKQEDDYRIARTELPTTSTIDLDNKTRNVDVRRKEVKHAIYKLTSVVDSKFVKQGIVHINGDLGREGRVLIVDHIHKHMPTAQLRAFHSKGTMGDVAVECIFFGDFPEED